MKINILDLIEFDKVDTLLEGFNKSTGFVTAILDLNGNVLSKSGWRQICTEFHRKNPVTSEKCSVSDTVLASKLAEGEKYHFYECLNGLVDVAVPIIVKEEHIANLFTGQFFFEKPDLALFKKQSAENGFNENEYLNALKDVPVVSKEKVKVVMDFLLNMTQLISDMAYQKLEQQQLNEALLKSEEKYRLISDNSDDWIYWVTPDGYIHYVSPACERVTGYTPEEFENDPELNHKIVFDTDKQIFNQHTKFSELDNTPHELEFRIITKGGDIQWVSHSCSPIFSSNGEYLGRRGTNRNITVRKLQEEQLFESEFRFSKLYENGPFGMVMADKGFRFKKANPEFCTIMGYTEAELMDFTFKDLTHPDDIARDLINIKKLMSKEISVYKTEKRYVRKDGQVLWGSLTVTATYDSEGGFLYYLGVVEDITRRKQAEENLIKSKKLLSETESMGRVGGWEFNIDTMVQTWTDEVYRIHEVDSDFNPNVDNGIVFYTPESRPVIEKAVQRVLDSGEPFDLELEIITAKGNLRKVHTIGKADFDSRRVYGFFQDITERKKLEESILKNEARLSSIFEQANDGIYIISADNRYLDVNEKGLQLLGYLKEELLKLSVADVLHPDEVSRLAIEPPKMMSGIPHFAEWQHMRKDGSTFPGEVSAKKLNENSYLAIVRDLTERKQAEGKIHELNERISTATRASQVGIWDWDIKNNVLTWDDQMYKLYGLKREEFAGAYEAWVNGLHPDDREYSQNETQLALFGEKDYDAEFRIVWPDGTVRYCKAKGEVFRNDIGEPVRMVGVNYDITDRKLIEKELQKSEEYLKLGYETANLGIWKNDLKTMDVEFDEQARIHYGFDDYVVTLSEVIARIHPDDMNRLQTEIENATGPAGTGRYSTEYRVIHPDGSVHWLFIGVRVNFEGEGENRKSVIGYGTSLDITQIRQAEENIRRLNEELEKRVMERTSELESANKELESFSYSVSHDLRAPLRHINGYVDLLNNRFLNDLPEKAQYYLNNVTDSATQMGELIDDLLNFSRTGRQELHKSYFDLNSLVNKVIDNMKPDLQNRKINWKLQKLPFVFGDYAMLKQVWINLVDNAIKYTINQKSTEISIGFEDHTENFEFYIKDNGVGFDMKYAHKLFGVFQRLHSQSDFKGTGIGLANVQRIIHRHSGRVWANAESGKGAEFYFTLPKIKPNHND